MTAAAKRLGALLLAAMLWLAPALAITVSKEEAMVIGMVSLTTKRLNPLVSEERDFMALGSLVYEGLVRIDDDYQPRPWLAERWESSGSGGTWTFTLREGAYFHDGSFVTANDVVATVNEILRLANDQEGPTRGTFASLRYMIKKATALDDRRVEISTGRNNYGFLYAMDFPILPASQINHDNPVGSGPFQLGSFVPQDYLMLNAFDYWWDGRPTIREVMCIFHKGSRELMNSYEYNRVDAALTRTLTAAQYRSGTSTLNLSYRTRQLETLLINNRAREFVDVAVRKALRYAINVDAIANTSYLNMVTRTDTPLVPGSWAYREMPGVFVQDLQKANQLLDEAGWTDSNNDGIRDRYVDGKLQNLSLRFLVYEELDNAVRISTAHQIASMLSAVGIEARVTPLSFEDTLARLKAANYDIALAAFNVDQVPDPGFLLISGNTGNYMRYKSERMDALFKELRATMDKDAYQQKLYEIQQLYAEDCPMICLFYRNGSVISRRMYTSARNLREPDPLRGIENGPQTK